MAVNRYLLEEAWAAARAVDATRKSAFVPSDVMAQAAQGGGAGAAPGGPPPGAQAPPQPQPQPGTPNPQVDQAAAAIGGAPTPDIAQTLRQILAEHGMKPQGGAGGKAKPDPMAQATDAAHTKEMVAAIMQHLQIPLPYALANSTAISPSTQSDSGAGPVSAMPQAGAPGINPIQPVQPIGGTGQKAAALQLIAGLLPGEAPVPDGVL